MFSNRIPVGGSLVDESNSVPFPLAELFCRQVAALPSRDSSLHMHSTRLVRSREESSAAHMISLPCSRQKVPAASTGLCASVTWARDLACTVSPPFSIAGYPSSANGCRGAETASQSNTHLTCIIIWRRSHFLLSTCSISSLHIFSNILTLTYPLTCCCPFFSRIPYTTIPSPKRRP